MHNVQRRNPRTQGDATEQIALIVIADCFLFTRYAERQTKALPSKY
jgi:hypothetical protein